MLHFSLSDAKLNETNKETRKMKSEQKMLLKIKLIKYACVFAFMIIWGMFFGGGREWEGWI